MEERSIEFYIVEGETIPTKLRLTDGRVKCNYEHGHDGVGSYYQFNLYDITDEEDGLDFVKKAFETICNQSYDHGQELRATDYKLVDINVGQAWGSSGTWRAYYRIKDSW